VPARGRLLALEGIDGSGKSTQARALAAHLNALLTHEPGATTLGATLRQLLLAPDSPPISLRAEALLMAADRAEHIATVIEPALSSGRWVVSDRFSGSTLAYQGYGRGLEVDGLRRMVEWTTDGLAPDLSLLIDVPVEVAQRRLAETSPDRLERLGPEFAQRVRDGFLSQADADPDHWVVIDGATDVVSLTARIVEVVQQRLGDPERPAGA
jgi:dTMP kinase